MCECGCRGTVNYDWIPVKIETDAIYFKSWTDATDWVQYSMVVVRAASGFAAFV